MQSFRTALYEGITVYGLSDLQAKRFSTHRARNGRDARLAGIASAAAPPGAASAAAVATAPARDDRTSVPASMRRHAWRMAADLVVAVVAVAHVMVPMAAAARDEHHHQRQHAAREEGCDSSEQMSLLAHRAALSLMGHSRFVARRFRGAFE
jgi:hypothetical protein